MHKSCWKSTDCLTAADGSGDELIKPDQGLKENQVQSPPMIDVHGNPDDSNVTDFDSTEANKTEEHFVTAIDEIDEFYSPQEDERERNVFAFLERIS